MRKVIWSPVEVGYLKKHKADPVNQLCIALAKSRYAVNQKLKELKTGKPAPMKKKTRRSKIGKRPDCNNLFFRSSWEANVYRLLRLDKSIVRIEYEPKDFGFWDFGIKRGTVSYTPDFRVTFVDGSYLWIEVKGGWMKPTDKTKIRRFKKYFPEEAQKLVAVSAGHSSDASKFFKGEGIEIRWYYPELNKKYKNSVQHWE